VENSSQPEVKNVRVSELPLTITLGSLAFALITGTILKIFGQLGFKSELYTVTKEQMIEYRVQLFWPNINIVYWSHCLS
jgi:hypothetical protein